MPKPRNSGNPEFGITTELDTFRPHSKKTFIYLEKRLKHPVSSNSETIGLKIFKRIVSKFDNTGYSKGFSSFFFFFQKYIKVFFEWGRKVSNSVVIPNSGFPEFWGFGIL